MIVGKGDIKKLGKVPTDLNSSIFLTFFIIKYVGLEPVIFAINLDTTLSSKVFNIFYYIFVSIILLT